MRRGGVARGYNRFRQTLVRCWQNFTNRGAIFGDERNAVVAIVGIHAGQFLFRGKMIIYQKMMISNIDELRRNVKQGMIAVMGEIPGDEKRVPLEMRVEDSQELPHFTRQLISFNTEPNERIAAYLLIPSNQKYFQAKHPRCCACIKPHSNKRTSQLEFLDCLIYITRRIWQNVVT